MGRDQVVALFQGSFGRTVEQMGTQQLYGNVVIDIERDTARVRSYLLSHHHVPGLDGGDTVDLRAAYTDELVRTAHGWKIAAMTLTVLSMVGNAAVFA